jgi:hypothetical protein
MYSVFQYLDIRRGLFHFSLISHRDSHQSFGNIFFFTICLTVNNSRNCYQVISITQGIVVNNWKIENLPNKTKLVGGARRWKLVIALPKI